MKTKSPVFLKAVVLITLLVIPGIVYMYLIDSIKHFAAPGFYGPREAKVTVIGGINAVDTIYHSVPEFAFTNQKGNTITDNDLNGKIYVADFFFTTCKSICPKMTAQLERVQKEFSDIESVALLSHTVDPEQDSVPVLKDYAEKSHAEENKWNFVTGSKVEIYEIARKGYFVTAMDGDGGEEDFIHSPLFVLIDKEKHIRGYYDGTSPEEVDDLIHDIKRLMIQYDLSSKNEE